MRHHSHSDTKSLNESNIRMEKMYPKYMRETSVDLFSFSVYRAKSKMSEYNKNVENSISK